MGFGDPQNPSDKGATGSTVACGKSAKGTSIVVVLRSRQGFDSSTELKVDYLFQFLPTQCPIGPAKAFKNLETRFYIDLATKEGALWYAKRKITAVVKVDGQPADCRWVHWEKISGSDHLMFDVGGTGQPTVDVPTDNNGLAEVTIRHVVENVSKDDRSVWLRATVLGASPPVQGDVELKITRNDDVSSLEDVMKDPAREGLADAILVFQPTAEVESKAVGAVGDDRSSFNKGLNHLLNQVVSRHKGVAYSFIDEDGLYGDKTKTAVQQFITNFISVVTSDWPYNLSSVGVYRTLQDYVNLEYAPFAYQDGLIVDRHLLIGTQKNDNAADIDGLQELKTGVVDKLVDEMKRVALDYINSRTFWLHRPGDDPHVPTNEVGAVVIAANVQAKSQANGSTMVDASGAAVIIQAGRAVCLEQTKVGTTDWYRVQLSDQSGWVSNVNGRFYNDRKANLEKNSGNPGVAYSYGCKDTPEEFRTKINFNEPGPASIVNWLEYTIGHKPGLHQGEFNQYCDPVTGKVTNPLSQYNPNKWTGIDCSGFCQRCITLATFDKRDPMIHGRNRIVPEVILRGLLPGGEEQGDREVGCKTDLCKYARTVTYSNNPGQQWIRGGDLIASDTHIVWVAGTPNDTPDAKNDKQEFSVYNAYGMLDPEQDLAKREFWRKTIEMPFSRWGVQLSSVGVDIGRVYIWQ
jgi:hypothetical protein